MFGRMYSLRNGYRTKQWKIISPIEVKKSLWAYREWKRKLNRNQHKPILKETETVTHLTQCNAQHLPDDVLRNYFSAFWGYHTIRYYSQFSEQGKCITKPTNTENTLKNLVLVVISPSAHPFGYTWLQRGHCWIRILAQKWNLESKQSASRHACGKTTFVCLSQCQRV